MLTGVSILELAFAAEKYSLFLTKFTIPEKCTVDTWHIKKLTSQESALKWPNHQSKIMDFHDAEIFSKEICKKQKDFDF